MSETLQGENDVNSPQGEEQVLTADEALSLAVALYQQGQLAEAEVICRRHLEPHGRYSHTEEYVEGVAAEAGLAFTLQDRVVLRQEAGEPVEGILFVARKEGSPEPD